MFSLKFPYHFFSKSNEIATNSMALYSIVWLLLVGYLIVYPGILKVLNFAVLNLITFTTDLMTQE